METAKHNIDTSGNQRIIIAGPSASGKSVLAKTLLTEHFKGKFNQIYLICPTMHQPLWKNVLFKDSSGTTNEKSNKYDEATNETFDKVMEKIKENFKKGWRSLLIIDDAIGSELMKINSSLTREFLRIRHYHCTCVIITQNIKKLPCVIRSNATIFASFHNPNEDEVRKCVEEYGHKFKAYYDEYTSEPYKYIWCNLEKNELMEGRYSNEINFPDKF